MTMKTISLKLILIFLITSNLFSTGQTGKDTLKYRIAINYLIDLSDTYGSGQMLSSELSVSKLWYGIDLSFGHFTSQDDFIFRIPVEEIGYEIEVPFEELTTMKMGTLSLLITPIQLNKFTTEIVIGGAYAKSQGLFSKGVEYTFDISQEKFISLTRDYQLVRNTHFGYQIGLRISYYPLERAGLELNVRMQDLSNGGTFFLAGGGFCFKF